MMHLLSIADLRRAKRDVTAPFQLKLGSLALPQPLEIQAIHRLLPGKRLTAKALWRGHTVLVKLFFDRFGYRRHCSREAAGLSALRGAKIATPRILAQVENPKQNAAVLITEYLPEARTLAQLQADAAAWPAAMAAALAVLDRMHQAGLEQRDIHPGNFLWADGKIHAIDGDGILTHPAPLADEQAQDNLALFLAQFPPALLQGIAIDSAALAERVRRQRDARWRAYRRKLLRDCTEIRCEQSWHGFLAVRREYDDAAFRELLADPDRYIAAAELLKDGNSATVALVQLPGRSVVVKRYNIKHWRHRLARCWRPSRAQHAWLAAHQLRFLDIATPKPMALLERRCGPWRGTAYFIAEHVAGETLLAKLHHKVQKNVMQPVARLLAQLFDARLAHGDMKASNLLCHEERPYLVDLDAMAWLPQARHFHAAYRKDRQRFLDNWPKYSAIRRWFDANLPQAGA